MDARGNEAISLLPEEVNHTPHLFYSQNFLYTKILSNSLFTSNFI